MQLTRFSDLGLRVLMYLTQQQANRPQAVTIGEVATQFAVPHNHLVKVVNRLRKLGWIEAIRGRKGGLHLAVEASALRLGAVLRELEGHAELINCAEPPCTLRGRCLLKGALNAGMQAFYDKLDQYSLADVCSTTTADALSEMHQQYLVRLVSISS